MRFPWGMISGRWESRSSPNCKKIVRFPYRATRCHAGKIVPAMFKNRQIRALLDLRQIDISQATGITMSRISLEERGLITYNSAEQAAITAYFSKHLVSYGYSPESGSSLEVAHA